jgi:taurine dioxygenase
MTTIEPTGQILGATVRGVDLARPLCNPGYAIRINELGEAESDRMLGRLFAHQLQPKYQYTYTWTEGDVLTWDHIGTLHNAIADYRPDEPRLMKRCQVMADKIFDPTFLHQYV